MDNFLKVFSYIGILASILGIFYTGYSLYKLRKSIHIGFLIDIRRIIEDVNREKAQFIEKEKLAYDILFRIQGELEVVYDKLLKTFSMKDIRKNK